ncbi:MAG: hypothetical protein H0W09_03640 [Solirubrobacterales bacterium]|nr:hypothetical protein [Solirubrobacterales bacterium]
MKTKVLGRSSGPARNLCPKGNCRQVIVRVTTYQAQLNGKRGPTKVPRDGHIVAFGMDLGQPSKMSRKSLARDYGGKATAQLAILNKQRKGRLKLLRKSNDVEVERFLNEQPRYALKQPLRVNRGDIVGLTTPTWLPTLGKKDDSIWRASQNPDDPDQCGRTRFLKRESRPHRKLGSTRRYRCGYRNRILYWAYFVAKRDGDGGGGGGNRATVIGEQPSLPSGGVKP